MKNILFLVLILSPFYALAQEKNELKGKVVDKGKENPLIGANVYWQGSTIGANTDPNGAFLIEDARQFDTLTVSFVGYNTLKIPRAKFTNPLLIKLEESIELKGVTIEEKVSSKQSLTLETGLVERISTRELKKAACCNLSESFETNPSVDVNFADAISGAKRVQMLGLDGIYSLITLEGIPEIRGLSASYGLTSIPGPWIESIQLAKGVGSVVHGYEAITGQINVELQKPFEAPKFHLNGYVNNVGRFETSVNGHIKVSDNWSTVIMAHNNMMFNKVDANDDDFLDIPMVNQQTATNRWKFYNDIIESQFGVEVFMEDRQAGQMDFEKGQELLPTNPWGLSVKQERFKAYAKVGVLPTDAHPSRSIGFINKYSTYRQTGNYGLKGYDGTNNYWYTNVIFQDQLKSKAHTYKLGGGFFIDNYDETLLDDLNDDLLKTERSERSAGAFGEYTYDPNIRFTFIAGGRVDYNNLFGWFATPRLHTRYKLRKNLTWRMAAGSGQRTPNVFVDNPRTMVSSRRISIPTDLRQEKAWNFGSSLVWDFKMAEREALVTVDVFHTEFENMLIMDMDANRNALSFYNLNGRSYSSVAQIEMNYELLKRLDTRISYKVQDVKTTFAEGNLDEVPFVAKNKFLFNTGYTTANKKWSIDLTALRTAPGRIAASIDQDANNFDSPTPFWRLNSQATFKHKNVDLYLGGENLTGFTQSNPIISSENPFSDKFDAGNVWAPVFGRIIYFGLRYTIY